MSLRSVRVLLVDDDTANARRIQRTLNSEAAPEFLVDEVGALSTATARLHQEQYDIALLNLAHHDVSGLGALALLQTMAPRLPIVVLAPAERESLALKAVQAGASDYLITEQIYRTVLVRAIRHGIERQQAEARSRAAERALRESEALYRALFEQSRDAIMLMDRQRRIVDVNPATLELLGYSALDLAGKSFESLYVDDGGVELRAQLALDGAAREHETRLRHRGGGAVWCLLAAAARKDDNGEIVGYQAIIHDITERKRAEERLRHHALHDSLTGLPNRALFADRLGVAIARTKRHPLHRFAVLFLDLDRFKLINDSLGHAAGDAMLRRIADVLRSCVRAEDTIARLGGDEFAVLLDGITADEDAIGTAERIQSCLTEPLEIGAQLVFTSASIGISFPESAEQPAEELLRNADIAMYRAKSEGPARHVVFRLGMHERATEQLEIETDLRQALINSEFVLHYQPIIALAPMRVSGMEALVRWHHPRRGMLMPEEFIGVAEDTGLIVPLGWWAMEEACRQARMWMQFCQGEECPTISVNLSSEQLRDPDLVERMETILGRHGVPGRMLSIEITESTLMSDSAVTAALLIRMRALGIRLCLDDFGTGYSSLAYLHALPIDVLKIDRSFVAALGTGSDRAGLCGTIIGLARRLDITVVAEGVETQQQLEQLNQLGAEYAQGFLFSAPLEASRAAGLLVTAG